MIHTFSYLLESQYLKSIKSQLQSHFYIENTLWLCICKLKTIFKNQANVAKK